ncbi:MAG: Cu2+-exporting ATPase [Haloarculaceae archaeon]|jgi:Cu2+-exporting ATPase
MTASDDASGEETCALCGLSLSRGRGSPIENDAGEPFCCPGCLQVHDALDDASELAEHQRPRATPDEAEVDGDGDGPPPGDERTFLRVGGMHCPTCEAFLETVGEDTPGVDRATASYVTETVRVDYDPARLTEDDLAETFSVAGYTAYRREDRLHDQQADENTLWRLVAGVVLSMWVMLPYAVLIYPVHFGLLYPAWMREMVRGMLTSTSAQYFFIVTAFFSGLVLVITGGPLLKGAYVSLRTRTPNMDLLVALAATSAYLYSTVAVLLGRLDVYYDVTVAIVVVVTAGTYYESSIKRKATDRLSALTATQVTEARRYEADGSTAVVDVDALEPGDRVLVRAGDRIPVDGVVCDGEGTVDEAIVTGESLPVGKREGDDVVGGSLVTDGAVVVEVGDDADSSIDRISDLVWDLQSTTRGVQKLADKLAAVFVPGVIALAVLAGGVHLALGAGAAGALLVALTVLLVSCPCALGLATPLAVAAGIRDALERGIVVFDQTVFERLREIDVVVFDKTGTLTTGELTVLDADAPDDLLGAAATLERRSAHPVAEAIVTAVDESRTGRSSDAVPDGGESVSESASASASESASDPDPSAGESSVEDFQSHARGVEGTVEGTEVLVGHPDLFAERDWSVPAATARRARDARERGRLPVLVGRDGTAEGVVVTADEPREGWRDVVAGLRGRDVEVVVLTGDEREATEQFRDHDAIDQVFADVPPEAKAETVRRLGQSGQVAMVGDGTNDAPALASADLGIALGSGTALAVDAADLAIVDDDLTSIETAFDLSAGAGRRVAQNIGWAFCYNAIAIPLALAGLLNPLFATLAMATSSLLVVTNSARAVVGSETSYTGRRKP